MTPQMATHRQWHVTCRLHLCAARWVGKRLGLPAPGSPVSARLVRDALGRIERQGLTAIVRPTGENETVRLLDPGTGGDYPGSGGSNLYVTLGRPFWVNGWHAGLPSRALMMLLITLDRNDNLGNDIRWNGTDAPAPVWVAPALADAVYGVSEATRTRGWRELERQGLLEIDNVPMGGSGPVRMARNTYRLVPGGFHRAPDLKIVDV